MPEDEIEVRTISDFAKKYGRKSTTLLVERALLMIPDSLEHKRAISDCLAKIMQDLEKAIEFEQMPHEICSRCGN